MLTLQQIRYELKEIQYYYAKQKLFDTAAKTAVQSCVLDKVNRYSQAMKDAPIKLYELYISLYVNNNTQEALAYDWDCSTEYIKKLNKQLCNYLLNVLGK